MAEKTLLAKQDALVRNREELEALAARLFRKQEEERRRVAAQLNGNLTQTLAAMSLQVAHLAAPAAAPGQSHALQECIASLGHYLHDRSEEHTSELQSLRHLVCRLLLE